MGLERELALAAKTGSIDAFEELVVRVHPRLFRFLAIRVGRAEADELTQESFVLAWRKLESYDPRWSFATWLFGIAKRVAASHGRARERRGLLRLAGAPEPEDAQADPHAMLEREELGQNIWRLARTVLTPDQCSALWLRYAEDATIEEIASILGKGQAGVRSLLFRARETFGRHIEPNGERRALPRIKLGMESH